MIDTHCHLTHPRLAADQDAVLARAREAGLVACISIGTGVEDAKRVAALTRCHPGFVFGTAGLDPFSSHAAGEAFDEELSKLETLFASGSFVAVGEIGLDYHYELGAPALQASRFERQLDLALRLDLPVVIHVREAHADMAAILASHARSRGVIHSFTAGPAEAECYLELGFLLAFNGVLTFPKAAEVREAARLCPAERLLLETDAPYLAPAPRRGERAEPAHVALTLARLAEARGDVAEAVAATTTANARRLFGLPGPTPA